jgi:glycosyltransferase involved in cell wall biosynthesis
MRVARIVAKLEPGGAQLTALRLAKFMRELGIETRLLAGFATADGVAMYERNGIPVEMHGSGKDLQYGCSKRFVRWLESRLADVDLIHAHMFGAWWAAAYAKETDVPLVASEHNAYQWPSRPRLTEMRKALSAVDLFFAHGPSARRLVLKMGLPAERLRSGVAPITGLDARARGDLPSPRVVFAGRLHHEKGPDVLLKAIARLEQPPATLILGAGEMEAALRGMASELGIQRAIRFAGWQPDPGSFIAGASALVVPSRREAWSQSAVTAMGLGVPVIGTAVEGLPLTLGNGRGVLVPPEDPGALATAIADVLAGRRMVDRRETRAYALRFAPERVATVYANAYRSLTARADTSEDAVPRELAQ